MISKQVLDKLSSHFSSSLGGLESLKTLLDSAPQIQTLLSKEALNTHLSNLVSNQLSECLPQTQQEVLLKVAELGE